MEAFRYRGNELYCEAVPLSGIARRVGTPVYVYSQAAITAVCGALASAFRKITHTICYSVKANSNLSILRLLVRLGTGFDIVSAGELYRLRQAGADPSRIVFSGVGKTADEIDYALRSRILLFNVESLDEVELLSERARRQGAVARLAVRVNPDVDPRTHPHIATGQRVHKFGLNRADALKAYRLAARLPNLKVAGVSCHIGSQVLALAPFRESLRCLVSLIAELRREGFSIAYLDFGGGLGIRYTTERPPSIRAYAREVLRGTRALSCHLILEPGRVLVGNAGALVSRVLYSKPSGRRNFVVVDAGMNDFLRPALYKARHPILISPRRAGRVRADVVGPLCETGDAFASGVTLGEPRAGDLVVFGGAGAYGFVQSSNYNSRPRAAEVLVNGKNYCVIRRRESLRDLIRGE